VNNDEFSIFGKLLLKKKHLLCRTSGSLGNKWTRTGSLTGTNRFRMVWCPGD